MASNKRKIEEIVCDLKTNCEKKLKSGDSPTNQKSKMASNKESQGDSGQKSLQSESETKGDNSGEQSLRSLMLDISKDINASISGLNERMSQMEDNLEHKLIESLSNIINITVKEEVKKVRSDLDSEICAIRTKVMDMEDAVKGYTGAASASAGTTQTRSVVIRNLRQGHNESEGANSVTKNKVISLVRDGLKLRDARVTSAERKQHRGDNPGIVIASFETAEQSNSVLSVKKDLRKTNEYKSVYIEPCLNKTELSTQATFRTLLKEMGKSDRYHVHGSRLIPRHQQGSSRGQSGPGNQPRDRSPGHDVSSGRSDNQRRNKGGRSHSRDRSGSYADIAGRDNERRENTRSDRSHNNGRDHDRNGVHDKQNDRYRR